MRSLVSFALLISTAALLPATTGPAHAAAKDVDAEKAKRFFEQGTKHYQVGEYKEALDAYRSAYFAKRSPAFLYNMAQCYRQLGDWPNAVRQYRAFLREAPEARNREEVEGFIEEGERAIANASRPPNNVVAPDGSGTAPGPTKATTVPASAIVAPVDGQQAEKKPELETKPAAAKKKSRAWVWGLVGGGAAVVVAGAIGLGVGFGTAPNAPTMTGTDPTASVAFH